MRLKIQRIKEYIDIHGASSSADLAAAAGYDTTEVGSKDYQAGTFFVRSLAKKDILYPAPEPGRVRYLYKGTTHSAAATLTPTKQSVKRRYTFREIEAYAIEYAWHNDSNDLRSFITALGMRMDDDKSDS